MTQNPDRVAQFIGASQANGTMPLPLAWQQALDGQISVEEAAQQRAGLDPPEQLELYRRLCRPIDDLEHRRFEERFLPRRRGRARYLYVLSGIAAAAAAFCVLRMPDDELNRGAVVAAADPPLTFALEVKSPLAETRGGDRRDSVRLRLDFPVFLTLTPSREDNRIASARIALYVRFGDELIVINDDAIMRSKQGTFNVKALNLRRLLGKPMVGPATLFAVVALDGAPIVEPPQDGPCTSTERILCMAVDIMVENE